MKNPRKITFFSQNVFLVSQFVNLRKKKRKVKEPDIISSVLSERQSAQAQPRRRRRDKLEI